MRSFDSNRNTPLKWLLQAARGLPSRLQDAKGQRIRYEYDKAIHLTALVNENNAAYQFAYDDSGSIRSV